MKKQTELNGSIEFKAGAVKGQIFGGRFRDYVPGTRRLVGIKMAAEITHPHEFKVDTEDYSVPSQKDMTAGVLYAIEQLAKGNDIYVGCMGGIGRTGLFMGCMAKVMQDYAKTHLNTEIAINDVVKYVRESYYEHAMETEQQKKYATMFDTTPALKLLSKLDNDKPAEVKIVEKLVIREKEVVKEVFLTPMEWAMRLMFGKK